MGWAGLLNGDLLDQAVKAGVEVLVTCDQNIVFPQNISARQIAGHSCYQSMGSDPGTAWRG
jgi:hypothetical protein